MNPTFLPCRTSSISKLGCLCALYVYTPVGIVLLLASCLIGIELITSVTYTVEQVVILLLAAIASILLSSFLLIMSRKCYRMETRHIAIGDYGLIIKERTNRWYTWEAVEEICIIAYAANASKQIYQTQICIFLEPISDVSLRMLRDSYLYGAFGCDKYVLLDYNSFTINKLKMHVDRPIEDLRIKQLAL